VFQNVHQQDAMLQMLHLIVLQQQQAQQQVQLLQQQVHSLQEQVLLQPSLLSSMQVRHGCDVYARWHAR